jgi:hypothetical protein
MRLAFLTAAVLIGFACPAFADEKATAPSQPATRLPPVLPTRAFRPVSSADVTPPVASPPLAANPDNGNATVIVPAGRRLALVIGNSAYRSVPFLPNPVRDATAVADVLRKVGFQSVTLVKDVTRDKVVEALRNFTKEADNSD